MDQRNDDLSPEDRDAEIDLATRYVLGELSEEEFADFEARYATDEGFRQRYNVWAARLSEEEHEPAPEPPSAFLKWKARFFPTEGQGLLARLGVVQAVVGALAAALLFVLVSNMGWLNTRPNIGAENSVFVSTEGEIVGRINLVDDGQAIEIEDLKFSTTGNQVIEAWVVFDGSAPTSLGILSPEDTSKIEISDEMAVWMDRAVVLLTLEPEGGAGAAGPTGDVLAAAAFETEQ